MFSLPELLYTALEMFKDHDGPISQLFIYFTRIVYAALEQTNIHSLNSLVTTNNLCFKSTITYI